MIFQVLDKIPYRIIYIFFLSVLAFGLSTGEILMSIPSIAIAALWVLERKFQEKWDRIVELRYAPLAFLLIYVVHIVWLIGTQSLSVGLNDLVLKLPLLCFPIVLGTIPALKKIEWRIIVGSFLAGVTISSLVGMYVYNTQIIEDHRQLSVFISHIRLSLMLGLALFIIGWHITREKGIARFILIIPAVIMVTFIRLLESGTGFAMLLVMAGLYTVYLLFLIKSKWVKITSLVSLTGLIIGGAWYVQSIYSNFTEVRDIYEFTELPYQSENGEIYMHDTSEVWLENGNYIWINIAPVELETTWNEVSHIPMGGLDNKGQTIYATLLRYLTSKGERKDREAILGLTPSDIENIENGITSVVPVKTGFTARVEEVVYEWVNLKLNHNPNGHSVVQRLHYLNAGNAIFKRNLWLGIGTGDEIIEFDKYYIEIDSPLTPKNRLRAHNQFISILVCFGLIGGFIIAFAFIYPIVVLKLNWVFVATILTIIIGFLTDDTLDTQAGVSLVAFTYTLFLFHPIPEKN